MTYEGSTIAVVGNAFFEGAVDIEVLWGSAAGADDTLGNADDVINATLDMSISDLENMADASPMYLDTDTTANASSVAANALREVVSIEISSIDVDAMLALSSDTGTEVTVNYREPGQVASGSEDWIAAGSATSELVTGQFVGLGVSGPLAVLGIWEMTNNISTFGESNNSAALGAKVEGKNAAKTAVNRVSVTGMTFANSDTLTQGTFTATQIHGGFGAELP